MILVNDQGTRACDQFFGYTEPVLPPGHRCLGAFLPKTLCLLSGLRGKMAERELLFQRSMRGPLASAAINKKWVTDSSAEQTLEEKP